MKYKISHTTKYTYSEAVPVCKNLVHLQPRILPHQSCSGFRLLVLPEPFSSCRRNDYFDNHVSYFAVNQAHRGLTVTATSEVEVTARNEVVPDDTQGWESVVQDL
ncbi:MAG: transglutaminase family protein, partial [Pirellulales bacterium]|nr:transglutaminase family protein [Pirellulales bacterium]